MYIDIYVYTELAEILVSTQAPGNVPKTFNPKLLFPHMSQLGQRSTPLWKSLRRKGFLPRGVANLRL